MPHGPVALDRGAEPVGATTGAFTGGGIGALILPTEGAGLTSSGTSVLFGESVETGTSVVFDMGGSDSVPGTSVAVVFVIIAASVGTSVRVGTGEETGAGDVVLTLPGGKLGAAKATGGVVAGSGAVPFPPPPPRLDGAGENVPGTGGAV
jgi:hypothetical protein